MHRQSTVIGLVFVALGGLAMACGGPQPVAMGYGRPPSESLDAEGCPQGGAAGSWPAHCTGRYVGGSY